MAASVGQKEKPRKERRCDQGTARILEGPSAICGAEKPRRGAQSGEGRKAQEKSERKKELKNIPTMSCVYGNLKKKI